MSKQQSEFKSEISKLRRILFKIISRELVDNFYIIPKDSPPEKWVKIMVGEQEHHEVFRESVKLKWKTQEGGK